MKVKLISIILLFCLLLTANSSLAQQNNIYNLKNKPAQIETGSQIAFSSILFLSAVNPIILYENKKVYFGITREFTLGFGKLGEYRISAEYSFLFRKELQHHFRFSAKYDIMSDLSTSEWIDSRTVVAIGTGYFLDGDGNGIFPEVTAGFRLWEGDYIIFPYAKLRHTFMLTKDKPGNSDISLGMILGIKPF